jgi:hypothetical protein
MLALLSREVLRPGRDAAVIEIALGSLDDADAQNRLGPIRPEVALREVALLGMPTETRLDILVGAVAGLYRYRMTLQSQVLQPRIAGIVERLAQSLGRLGLVGAPVREPPYELVTVPGKDFVIEKVKGDAAAFQAASRRKLLHTLSSLAVGGFKTEAIIRAAHALAERGVLVFFVQIPTSRWYSDHLFATAAGHRYQASLPEILRASSARPLLEWPQRFSDETRFWDDTHMLDSSKADFTDELASRLAEALPPVPQGELHHSGFALDGAPNGLSVTNSRDIRTQTRSTR